jgi:peptidoglycan hydrolase-like protein with peptidoglycan-binding domain
MLTWSTTLSPNPTKKASLNLPVLYPGSSGSAVRILQQLLNFKGFNLQVNGEFNTDTLAAVKAFQHSNSLPVEGIVNSTTWDYLRVGLLPID